MIELAAGTARLRVDPADGGRWTSWRVGDLELLSGADTGVGAEFNHGCFPMAPYAGRVRDGRLVLEGREHRLPLRGGGHAIHGTVAGRAWTVVAADGDKAELTTALGPDWPAAGTVRQRLRLRADALETELELHAAQPMPVTIGWHPWFPRRLADASAELSLRGGAQWIKGPDGLPTGALDTPGPGPYDDAFRGLAEPPALSWPGVLRLQLESSASDVVVFDALPDVVCLEPQTGPPDAARLGEADVLPAGGTARLTCTWSWTTPGTP